VKIEIIELSTEDGVDIYEMIKEIGLGENGFSNSIPTNHFDDFKKSLKGYTEIANGINLPENYVPQTIYWLVANGKPVGYGKLRHYLNDKLHQYGGHIGYIIRPTERGKGFGTKFLSEILKEARKKEISKVLITCDEDNVRSRRVVESNNGQLEDVQNGICKYWISTKLQPVDAANKFIDLNFPNSQGAILAGSVVRGESTETSDLDIVVFDDQLQSSYRESLVEFDWPIEVFAYNLSSYKKYFKSDYERARPSLIRMISEGLIIKDNGIIETIKKEANHILEKGPEEWSEQMIRTKRYFITDALDDFIGCNNRDEEIFIASTLTESTHEFVLRTKGQWIGTSKWMVRALKHYDKNFAKEFVNVFDIFYKTGQKDLVIQLVDNVLKPYGGRLFKGYSSGKLQG
jgi:predicted acetyltransferase/predicted nucleotidyltransferase